MSEMSLPTVAKSIYLECKKCGAERYHRVLAHTSTITAKVRCEVCGGSKVYKLPKVQERSASSSSRSSGSSVRRSSSSTGLSASRARSSASSHSDEYHTFLAAHASEAAQAYSMKTNYQNSDKVDHPKFGLGFVRATFPDRVEIVFKDEVKTLIHNRA